MTDIKLSVLAAAQPAGGRVLPLCTTSVGADGTGLLASWLHPAGSVKRPRPDAVFASGIWPLTPASVMPRGHTNARNQHTTMTRVYAEREGGSGPQPLRKQPA